MDKGDIRDLIYSKLSELPSKKGINDIVELFTKHLNYKYQNNNIPKEIF
ncbi:MAG TPA: hypothetical protein PKJ39_02405 [Caldisericia bacterium]|nr:hypothetical protein [Caldisericia bacterium]